MIENVRVHYHNRTMNGGWGEVREGFLRRSSLRGTERGKEGAETAVLGLDAVLVSVSALELRAWHDPPSPGLGDVQPGPHRVQSLPTPRNQRPTSTFYAETSQKNHWPTYGFRPGMAFTEYPRLQGPHGLPPSSPLFLLRATAQRA